MRRVAVADVGISHSPCRPTTHASGALNVSAQSFKENKEYGGAQVAEKLNLRRSTLTSNRSEKC